MILMLSVFYNTEDEIQGLRFHPEAVRERLLAAFPESKIEHEDYFLKQAADVVSLFGVESPLFESFRREGRERGPAITFSFTVEGQLIRGVVNQEVVKFRCEGEMVEAARVRVLKFLKSFSVSEVAIHNV